jgi:fibronectin type 3 domain-containing protein
MKRAVAAVAGVSALATSLSGVLVATSEPALAQDVLNDWGQTPTQVQAEIDAVVEADARVVAARARYLHALATYAQLKKQEQAALRACAAARSTPGTTDNASTLRALARARAQVLAAAREVVTSQLALSKTVAAVEAQAQSLHYVQAPYVAVPAAPAKVVATSQATQVTLTWDAVPHATAYKVLRDGSQIALTMLPVYLDLGLTDAVTHSYSVIATNIAGWSAASPAATPTPATLTVPTGLVAKVGDGTTTLTWLAATPATGYQVLRDGVLVGSPAGTTFTDTGLTNGRSYGYRVLAVNGAIPSAPSALVTATPIASAPVAPTALVATPGNGQVALSWAPVVGATSYGVLRDGSQVGTPATPAYTDTGLVNGTSHTWTVVAFRQNSPASPASAPVVAAPVAGPLSAPTGLAATPGDGTVGLTWSPVAGAASYQLLRNGAVLATPTTPSFSDTGLTNGVSYSYAVRAVSATASSALSAVAVATPAAAASGAPTGLSAQAGDTVATLTWSTVAGATSYRVYRNGALRSTVSATSFADSALTNGSTYTYYVTAMKAALESAPSATVSATPAAVAPGTPTGVVAAPGNGQVALSWTASTGATSYQVYRGGVLVGSPSGTTFTDTGLTNGTSYSYWVVALAGTTPSAASSTVSATPVQPPVNGTFTGTVASIASGHGTLRVVIVVTNSKITSATGTLLTNDGSETVAINNNAIPQYNSKAVAASSATITKVSGASLTWAAYSTSLQAALTQAGL